MADDPFYSQYGKRCMDFKRSLAGQRPSCALGPRVQINLLTSSIDANFIYGSTETLAKRLRAFQGGKIDTSSMQMITLKKYLVYQINDLKSSFRFRRVTCLE